MSTMLSKSKGLFRSHTKSRQTPADFVRATVEGLTSLNSSADPKTREKVNEDLSRNILDIKEVLYGDTEKFPDTEAVQKIATEIFQTNLLSMLIEAVPDLEFDACRNAAQIVASLQRQKVGNKVVASAYLLEHTDLLHRMLRGYETPAIALFYGSMLRDCIRHQDVAQYVLECDDFVRLYDYIEMPSFEISSDAAATLRELLTRHKSTVATFLEHNYDKFFGEYNKLLGSPNYITRRMSIKMLCDVLLDKSNLKLMLRYVSNKENLVLVMNLFKVFVANKDRPDDITTILLSNQQKLLRFLTEFKVEKADKERQHFEDDKAIVVQQILDLKLR